MNLTKALFLLASSLSGSLLACQTQLQQGGDEGLIPKALAGYCNLNVAHLLHSRWIEFQGAGGDEGTRVLVFLSSTGREFLGARFHVVLFSQDRVYDFDQEGKLQFYPWRTYVERLRVSPERSSQVRVLVLRPDQYQESLLAHSRTAMDAAHAVMHLKENFPAVDLQNLKLD